MLKRHSGLPHIPLSQRKRVTTVKYGVHVGLCLKGYTFLRPFCSTLEVSARPQGVSAHIAEVDVTSSLLGDGPFVASHQTVYGLRLTELIERTDYCSNNEVKLSVADRCGLPIHRLKQKTSYPNKTLVSARRQ